MEYVYIYNFCGEIHVKANSKAEADAALKEMNHEEIVEKSCLVAGRTEFVEAREESDEEEEE